MHGKLGKKEIHGYLSTLQFAVLATVDKDNTPHTSTVFFTTDKDLNFYIMTKSSTQKYLNIGENKNIALSTVDTHKLRTVQVKGVIEKLNDEDHSADIIAALGEKSVIGGISYWPPPLSRIKAGEVVVLKITPNWLRYADFSHPPEEGREIFTQIIP